MQQTLSPSKKIGLDQAQSALASKAVADAIRALQSRCKSQSSELENKSSQLIQLTESYNKQMLALTNELDQTKLSAQKQRQEFERSIQAYSAEVKQQQCQNTELVKSLERAEQEHQELGAELRRVYDDINTQKNDARQMYQELSRNFEQERTQHQNTKIQIQELQEKLRRSVQENGTLQQQVSNLQNELSKHYSKLKEFEGKDQVSQLEKTQHSRDMKSYKNNEIFMKQQIEEMQSLISDLKFENEACKRHNQRLQQEIDSITENRQFLLSKNQKAEFLMQDVVSVNEKLVSTLNQDNTYLPTLASAFSTSPSTAKSSKLQSLTLQDLQKSSESISLTKLQQQLQDKQSLYKDLVRQANETSSAPEMSRIRYKLGELAKDIEGISTHIFDIRRSNAKRKDA